VIRIKAKNKHASVENFFEDEEYDKAFNFHSSLEEDGTWEKVDWISVPKLTVKDWTKKAMDKLLEDLTGMKIDEK
jgi:hypothetical protein